MSGFEEFEIVSEDDNTVSSSTLTLNGERYSLAIQSEAIKDYRGRECQQYSVTNISHGLLKLHSREDDIQPVLGTVLSAMNQPAPSALSQDIVRTAFGIMVKQGKSYLPSMVEQVLEQEPDANQDKIKLAAATSADEKKAPLISFLTSLIPRGYGPSTFRSDDEKSFKKYADDPAVEFFQHYNQMSGRFMQLAFIALCDAANMTYPDYTLLPLTHYFAGYYFVPGTQEIKFINICMIDCLKSNNAPIQFEALITEEYSVSPNGKINPVPDTVQVKGRNADFFEHLFSRQKTEAHFKDLIQALATGKARHTAHSLAQLLKEAPKLSSPFEQGQRLLNILAIIKMELNANPNTPGRISNEDLRALLTQIQTVYRSLSTASPSSKNSSHYFSTMFEKKIQEPLQEYLGSLEKIKGFQERLAQLKRDYPVEQVRIWLSWRLTDPGNTNDNAIRMFLEGEKWALLDVPIAQTSTVLQQLRGPTMDRKRPSSGTPSGGSTDSNSTGLQQ